MKNVNYIQNKRSNNVSSGLPSNPSPSDMMYGELAINYHNGIETIFTKNDTNRIVGFSSDDYYTSKKLGSGFTDENSANTVTSVIERNEKVTSAALNKLNTSIESVSSITAAALNELNDSIDSLSGIVEENEEIASSALNELNDMIGGIDRYWKNVEDSAITYDNVVDMLNYNIQYVKDNFVRKPVVLYQTDGTSGLLGENKNKMDLNTWQLENLDFSPYKYVMAYFKQADLGATSVTATPAVTVCIVLDDASLSSQYSAYIGGGGATNMNDRDIHFCVLCAIDSTKTKFKVLSEHSIAGTILGERNVNGRYCYKIEGHY